MNKPQTRTDNIIVQETDAELLIYDLIDNRALCLNKTSAAIYQLCDGTRTVAEITSALSRKLKQPVGEDLIRLALDQFEKSQLLENNDNFNISFNGSTRRQVIKKAGLASLVTLPVISAVIAPTAAQGASLLPLFASCSGNSQCQSNFCTQGPPRCCVAGTQGIRGANVCCDGTTANCNAQCCSNTGTISSNPGGASFGCNFIIACPNS